MSMQSSITGVNTEANVTWRGVQFTRVSGGFEQFRSAVRSHPFDSLNRSELGPRLLLLFIHACNFSMHLDYAVLTYGANERELR